MKLVIIGLGLIGGSLAKASRAAYPGCHITGVDPDADARGIMLGEGAVDAVHATPETAFLSGGDTVLLIATPPHGWEATAAALHGLDLRGVTLAMDAGSVKAYANTCFGSLPHFVAAHPIAGSEFSGAAFATAGLFRQKRVILTPLPAVPEATRARAETFWKELGMHPAYLEDAAHDRIYAYVSHIPQLLAYAVASSTLDTAGVSETYLRFLRLAGSSPALWHGIFMHNPHLVAAGEMLLQLLGHMLAELRTGVLEGAPDDGETGTRLLPRILASCLISLVTLEENRTGTRMASYAGSGFADMAHPAMTPPEEDMALISAHTNGVVTLLERVEATFRELLVTLKRGDYPAFSDRLHLAQEKYVRRLSEDAA